MRIFKTDIVFQEVPGEISLAFYACGCPIRCPGCHSSELWNEKNGYELSFNDFKKALSKYEGLISCVLFMGGEWNEEFLISLLKEAKSHVNLKTALYSGRNELSPSIEKYLDFVKLGPWISNLGGLTSPTTNQKLYRLPSWEQIVLHQGEPNETQI